MIDTKCAKCGGEMKKGFLAENTAGGVIKKPTWIEGEKASKFIQKKNPVTGFACELCGYIELYLESKLS